MAISTYAELQTAVANYLDRADLTDRIVEFIALAESRIARSVTSRSMVKRVTTNAATQYILLPDDFLEMRNIQLNTSPKKRLEYVSPEHLDSINAGSESGTPSVYTIIGNELQLGPTPDSTVEVEIAYMYQLPALSATNTTSWFLTYTPDLLLYGSLIEAEPFTANDERISLWKALFDEAVMKLNEQDERGRYSGSALVVRTDGGTP